ADRGGVTSPGVAPSTSSTPHGPAPVAMGTAAAARQARASFLPRSPQLQGRVGWAEPGLLQPPPLPPPPGEDQSRAAQEFPEREGLRGGRSPSRTKGRAAM
ncbi:hypothetical protein U0070_022607, partial [Myodes glareolus]